MTRLKCICCQEVTQCSPVTQLCNGCRFWVEVFKQYDNPKGQYAIVVTSEYEVLQYDKTLPVVTDRPNHCLGFAGHYWHITYTDGTVCVSNNVWSRGTVPDVKTLRDGFIPNATTREASRIEIEGVLTI